VNKNEDWIDRELNGSRVEPASEDFYHGVWNRIRSAGNTYSIPGSDRLPVSIGTACWKALPVFAALLLVISLYAWFYPPEPGSRTMHSAESYVLDSDNSLSDTDLWYQVMQSSRISEKEAEP